MSAREVLERMTAIARGEGLIPRSTPTGIHDLPPDWSDRRGALVELAKQHKLLTDRVDVTSGGQPFKAYIGFDPEDVWWCRPLTLHCQLDHCRTTGRSNRSA